MKLRKKKEKTRTRTAAIRVSHLPDPEKKKRKKSLILSIRTGYLLRADAVCCLLFEKKLVFRWFAAVD